MTWMVARGGLSAILKLVIYGAMALAIDPSPAIAGFEVRRAINIAQWFTWPRYEPSPATGIMWPPYKQKPRPPDLAELQDLRRAGFDTVRLPVDPAPFIVFEGERREAVYGMLFDAIAKIQTAGLNVIVDLHPNSRHPKWGQHAIIAGLEAPSFLRFSDVVADFAQRIARIGSSGIALELINEPRLQCRGDQQRLWQRMVQILTLRARERAPDLTLIVSGSCLSTIDGLIALDPAIIAHPATIFTFHFYEPFSFTHQGAQFIPWPDKYLDEVPWPAGERPIEQPLARLMERIAGASKLDAAARATATIGARINLEKFYASGAGPRSIQRRFSAVADWANRHGIEPHRIFIGEFGVLRKDGDLPGALCADRTRWLSDVIRAAETFGFSWSYFSYDGPFALVHSDEDRTLDESVLASLGLRPGKAKCQ